MSQPNWETAKEAPCLIFFTSLKYWMKQSLGVYLKGLTAQPAKRGRFKEAFATRVWTLSVNGRAKVCLKPSPSMASPETAAMFLKPSFEQSVRVSASSSGVALRPLR